ncbi:MAG: hypothetical protein Fur0022_13540 [Anaerolineales bacterium]
MLTTTLQMAQRGLVTIPKSLRKAYNLKTGDVFTLIDLGGVFVISPRASQVDAIADKIAADWQTEGETLESMLQSLRSVREKPGG